MGYHEDVTLFFSSMSTAALLALYRQSDEDYRSGSPSMSNQQSDDLREELRSRGVDVDDPCVLLSLENNRRCSFNEWYLQLPGTPVMVVQPKIDGISIGLRYVDGKLAEAFTRKGRSVLEWIQGVHCIPKQLKRKSLGMVEIHGEIWGVKKDSEDERTPQSIAAVSAKYNEESGARSSFAAYRLVGSLDNESKSIEDLRRYGFDVPDTYVCTKPSEVNKLHARWVEGHDSDRQPFNSKIFRGWPTDGVVAKVFDQRLQRKLGATKKAPRWAIALKKNVYR